MNCISQRFCELVINVDNANDNRERNCTGDNQTYAHHLCNNVQLNLKVGKFRGFLLETTYAFKECQLMKKLYRVNNNDFQIYANT